VPGESSIHEVVQRINCSDCTQLQPQAGAFCLLASLSDSARSTRNIALVRTPRQKNQIPPAIPEILFENALVLDGEKCDNYIPVPLAAIVRAELRLIFNSVQLMMVRGQTVRPELLGDAKYVEDLSLGPPRSIVCWIHLQFVVRRLRIVSASKITTAPYSLLLSFSLAWKLLFTKRIEV
jgi:hypothetical protein